MADIIVSAGGIYAIRNTINGKVYVGSAVSFVVRWRLHRSSLNRGKHHSITLQRAWVKYGSDAFEFVALEDVINPDKLIEREQFWIDKTRCIDPSIGYNISPVAGSSLGITRSAETRAKHSLSKTGRKLTPEHVASMIAARAGYKHSEEVKRKIGAAHAGKLVSDATRAKISALQAGQKRKPLSEETKRKISEANRGKKRTPEAIERMRDAGKARGFPVHATAKAAEVNRGRKMPPDAVARSAAASRGRKHTPEAREKMSLAHRARHQKLKDENGGSKTNTSCEGDDVGW